MEKISKLCPGLSIVQQCDLLEINRSGLYYKCVETCEDTVTLMNEIRDIWQTRPFYGYRRIHATLRRQGYEVNRKRVYRLMQEMGLQALYPKPKTSARNKEHKIYPYLLRNLAVTHADQVWTTDITYIPLHPGFVYLIAILDRYSRYIVSWQLSISLDTSFCVEALEEALTEATPDIFNTDQGSQFTSNVWTDILEKKGVFISMDGKGRFIDNIHSERLWRTIKYEEVYLKSYDSVREARESLKEYIEFYNHERPHQSLGYKTPAEIYFENPQKSKPDGYMDNLSKLPTYPQAQQQQQQKASI